MTQQPQAPPPTPYAFPDELPIGLAWRRGGGRPALVDRDPWTGEVLAEFTPACERDVDEAYLAAQEAQRGWAGQSPGVRAAVLRAAAGILVRRREEIVGWLMREAGGTRAKSESEWSATQRSFVRAATLPHRIDGRILPSDVAGKDHHVHRRPVGVVAVLSPSNFPLYLSSRTVAPALVAGNAVVLKPAKDTPVGGGLLLARVLQDAGLPPGVLNVPVGRSSEMGDVMVTHAVPRTVCFTGSSAAGEAVTRLAGVKDLILELGGNSAMVVLEDADLERAIDAAVWGCFYHQGQVRMSTSRIITVAALHDDFLDAFVTRVRALRVGDPTDPATQVGPLISRTHLEQVQDQVTRAVAAGGTLLLGGDPIGPTGLALPPHVLTGDARLATAREEVFGPVATLVRSAGEDEALVLANATDYALSGAIFTADVERGMRLALRLEAGMTHVNDATVHDEPHLPFGGDKQSGVGRCGAAALVEQLTTDHVVSVQRAPRAHRL